MTISIQGMAQSSDKTLILIAGAGHGSWCWEKVTAPLEAKGFSVMAVDLPGCGHDTTQLAGNSLDDDVRTVIKSANSVGGKVILLGHSSGGIVISQAAELLGPEKVDKLIYLDAFLPQNGESVFSLAEKLGNSTERSAVKDIPQAERFIFSEDKKSFRWNPKVVQQLFYHDCSPEDVAFAKERLSWQSVATLGTPVSLTENAFGAIKKYYILCTEGEDLDKSGLVSRVPSDNIYKLPSSHSPFFSMPEKLVAILEALY